MRCARRFIGQFTAEKQSIDLVDQIKANFCGVMSNISKRNLQILAQLDFHFFLNSNE